MQQDIANTYTTTLPIIFLLSCQSTRNPFNMTYLLPDKAKYILNNF